jgi:2,3-dihydroxybenzoate decarboxylase
MKKIACEEHYITPEFISYLRSRKEFPRREAVEIDGKKMEKEWWSATNFNIVDPAKPNPSLDLDEGRIEAMDKAGIDMQVLSCTFPGAFDGDDGATVAEKTNNTLAAAIKRHPKRYAGFASIAAQFPETAADELERAVTKLGFKGLMINGHVRGEYLDDKKYWPIFERAAALDVPIYIHPRSPAAGMLEYYTAVPALASAAWGYGAEAGLNAMRLIGSGLFDRYPKLQIIVGHMGEAIPFWIWRIDNKWPRDTKGSKLNLKKNPAYYIQNNLYVTTSGNFWLPALQYCCSVLGTERVLFAVDYPYESNELGVEFIESAPISDNDKEKICHLNAEKLFKL